MAMLCGHAASIADLGICYPSALAGDGDRDSLGNSLADEGAGALISACTDGVLCVWSRGSGHCRRRRKLAPWAGSPSVIQTLPSNRRYVCIGCSFVDCVGLAQNHACHFRDGGDIFADVEHKRPAKCTVLVVDTYTLSIVQTVIHGNLPFGLPTYMSVLSSSEDQEKSVAILVDSGGRMQKVPFSKDTRHPDGDDDNDVIKHNLEDSVGYCTDSCSDLGKVLSCVACGYIIAFLFDTRCLFRLVDTNVTVGKISFTGDSFSHGAVDPSRIEGCMFLEGTFPRKLTNCDSRKFFSINFILWDSKGSAVVYLISLSNEVFKAEPLHVLHSSSHPECVRQSVCFSQLNTYILCINSFCFQLKDTVLWKLSVTIWSLQWNHDNHQECKMLGQYDSFIEWSASSTPHHKGKGSDCEGCDLNSTSGDTSKTTFCYNIYPRGTSHGGVSEGQIVSSSMVLSENSHMPYAVVYGYVNGHIEVIRLDVVRFPYSHGSGSYLEVNPDVCRQYFSGHTSSVLCLATHTMVGSAKGWDFRHALISGSKDCTVRIWDLDSGASIGVLHHHVAPVRQIILPPGSTERPWIDCFLSMGEDSCVALVSLETPRVERIFPGHPGCLARVVWDGVRGYIACLCRSHARASDASDVLYIWDVKSGARERILRGTAAHSMFDHFCTRIGMNSTSGTLWSESTSVSSLLNPLLEDVEHPSTHPKKSGNGSVTVNVMPASSSASERLPVKTFVSRETPSGSCQAKPAIGRSIKHSVKCHSPFPGVASLTFDLMSLMLTCQRADLSRNVVGMQDTNHQNSEVKHDDPISGVGKASEKVVESDCMKSLEEYIIRFGLSLLHSWDVDYELDQLLIEDLKLKKPDLIISSGLAGDKGSLTLTFPGRNAVPEVH